MSRHRPDRLEDMLNQDEQLKTKLGGKTIHVYNFGLFSAGFPEFLDLAKNAARLKPDMIIVNYVSAAIGVCNQCNDSADTPLKDKERSLYSGEIPIDIDGQGKDVGYLKISCETLPIDLSNDTCSHSYNLVLPPDLAANPDKVRAIKRTIVKRYLRGKLVSSLYPYCWDLVRGKMPSVNGLRHPEWFGNGHKSWTLTDPQMVQRADRPHIFPFSRTATGASRPGAPWRRDTPRPGRPGYPRPVAACPHRKSGRTPAWQR